MKIGDLLATHTKNVDKPWPCNLIAIVRSLNATLVRAQQSQTAVPSANSNARTSLRLELSKEINEAARRSPRGIVSYMQDRIRKALKEAFADDAPEFWFVLERDNATRCHLHGAVVVPHPGCEPMIDEALRKAGGSWAQKSFQQVGSKLNDPIWWAHYTIKSLNMTVLDIDTRLFASTVGIRQAAREGWGPLRLKLQLKTSPATAPSAAPPSSAT